MATRVELRPLAPEPTPDQFPGEVWETKGVGWPEQGCAARSNSHSGAAAQW